MNAGIIIWYLHHCERKARCAASLHHDTLLHVVAWAVLGVCVLAAAALLVTVRGPAVAACRRWFRYSRFRGFRTVKTRK